MASINSFIIHLKMIDNLFLNRAPKRLIKKHSWHMNTPSDVVQILNIAKTMKRIHSDHHHQMARNNRLQSTSRPEYPATKQTKIRADTHKDTKITNAEIKQEFTKSEQQQKKQGYKCGKTFEPKVSQKKCEARDKSQLPTNDQRRTTHRR